MAPIVAVEARLRVRNPPRITAAAFPTVCSGFGIISFEFWLLEFSFSQAISRTGGGRGVNSVKTEAFRSSTEGCLLC